MNDAEEFQHTRKALTTIGLDAASQLEIFKLLSAILTLGNLDFVKKGEGSAIENQVIITIPEIRANSRRANIILLRTG